MYIFTLPRVDRWGWTGGDGNDKDDTFRDFQ